MPLSTAWGIEVGAGGVAIAGAAPMPRARAVFVDAVRRRRRRWRRARSAWCSTAPALGSLLVDNLNASIHLRALLTDLFLVDQAR